MEFLEPEQTYENQISLKVQIVGKFSIGKSFFCNRINWNYTKFQQLNLKYIPSNGIKFYNKVIKLRNKIFSVEIWDTCGQEVYQKLLERFYHDTQIFLIFYDALDRNSFERAKSYFEDIKKEYKTINPIYVLIRSKYENVLNREEKNDIVTDEEALEFADENNIYFFHIGILEKHETGINNLFEFILNKYINNNL